MPAYAELLRRKMKGADNAQQHPVTTRMLGRAVGSTYEYLRDIVVGTAVPSKELNRAICDYLGLDEALMWRLAQQPDGEASR
jgi:hypothetical protein